MEYTITKEDTGELIASIDTNRDEIILAKGYDASATGKTIRITLDIDMEYEKEFWDSLNGKHIKTAARA